MNALVYLYKRVLNLLVTTMVYTHILQQGAQVVPSPLDDLGI